MDSLPTHADFAAQLETSFTMHLPDGTTRQITLHRVTDLVKRPPQEAFTLIFMAPADTPPEQQIYRIEHSELGAMDLFLVPIAQDDRGIRFEAVFNQLFY